jgi:AAHS family 4-hydroxybenzoate transporter-like MFS transporter
MLALWRFITGIGLGGALTTATALVAEFSPRRFRAQAIGAIQMGAPIGGMTGAALAAELIPSYGWRSVFVVGGAPPVLAAAVMYFVLPESPCFLAAQGQSATGRSGLRALFTPQLRWDTAIVSLAFLTNMYAVYAFFSWAPLVLTSRGFELVTAVRGALVFNLAGIVGVITISLLIARLGSRRPLAVFAFVSAAASSRLECRTSGVGWVLGTGRVGGIASSLGGGLLLTLTGAGGFFGCIAAVLLFTFASVLAVRRQVTASHPLPAPGPGTTESSDPGTRISDGSLRTPDPAYPPRR